MRKQTESDSSAWVGMGKVLQKKKKKNPDQMQRTLKAFKQLGPESLESLKQNAEGCSPEIYVSVYSVYGEL